MSRRGVARWRNRADWFHRSGSRARPRAPPPRPPLAAAGHAHVCRQVVERISAQDPLCWFRQVNVFHPFPNIAQHVV